MKNKKRSRGKRNEERKSRVNEVIVRRREEIEDKSEKWRSREKEEEGGQSLNKGRKGNEK